VLPWRQREWRQALGPFSEIFPSWAYLKKSFEKRAKKPKRRFYIYELIALKLFWQN
jgi:hypothetical protein